METRNKSQVKMYKLILNNMTSPNIEMGQIAIVAYDRQELLDYIKSQETEYWKDDMWGKHFKKDSPLEWYNPLTNYEEKDSYGHGIYEEWVDEDVLDTLSLFIVPHKD